MIVRALALLALLVASACGTGGARGEDAAPSTEGAEGEALALAAEVPDELVSGEPVTWRLAVTNRSDEPVVLTFPTGQQGEVVLRDGSGEEVLRWSEGMMFTQAVSEIPLAPESSVTFDLPGDLDVEPGTYELEASVPSDPAPAPVTREVTVTG